VNLPRAKPRMAGRAHDVGGTIEPKQAALQLGFVTEEEFDRVVDPKKMVKPYVATDARAKAAR